MIRLETPAPPAAPLSRTIADHVSARPGPTVIAVGGIHGNEPAGIEAALRVHRWVGRTGPLERGRFLALRGNLAALSSPAPQPTGRPRYLSRDLNRLFTDTDPAPGGAVRELSERDEVRSAIAAACGDATGPVYLLDLHTVSADSPPFIAVEDSLPARRFALRFHMPILLGVEEELPGLLMDDATRRHGAIALTVEGGRHDSPGAADTLESVLWAALQSLRMISTIPGGAGVHADPASVLTAAARGRARCVYDVRHREPIGASPFAIEPGLGAFSRVRAGRTVIARQGSGEAQQRIVAAESGLLFMPNRQGDPRVGDDAYFIVRRVGRFWLALSAWLRTRRSVHSLLPRVLPGVRARPDHPNELIVTPGIAAVLRREVFHLLGYRLVRFAAAPHTGTVRRCLRGVALFAAAVPRVVGGVVRPAAARIADDAEAGEWIVRRRRLDIDAPSESPSGPDR